MISPNAWTDPSQVCPSAIADDDLIAALPPLSPEEPPALEPRRDPNGATQRVHLYRDGIPVSTAAGFAPIAAFSGCSARYSREG